MRKTVVAGLAVAALAVPAAPAQAHYMSTREAKLAILDNLRGSFEFGVAKTGWVCRRRKSPHYVLCTLAVKDLDGDFWGGYGEARLRRSGLIGTTYNIDPVR